MDEEFLKLLNNMGIYQNGYDKFNKRIFVDHDLLNSKINKVIDYYSLKDKSFKTVYEGLLGKLIIFNKDKNSFAMDVIYNKCLSISFIETSFYKTYVIKTNNNIVVITISSIYSKYDNLFGFVDLYICNKNGINHNNFILNSNSSVVINNIKDIICNSISNDDVFINKGLEFILPVLRDNIDYLVNWVNNDLSNNKVRKIDKSVK